MTYCFVLKVLLVKDVLSPASTHTAACYKFWGRIRILKRLLAETKVVLYIY